LRGKSSLDNVNTIFARQSERGVVRQFSAQEATREPDLASDEGKALAQAQEARKKVESLLDGARMGDANRLGDQDGRPLLYRLELFGAQSLGSERSLEGVTEADLTPGRECLAVDTHAWSAGGGQRWTSAYYRKEEGGTLLGLADEGQPLTQVLISNSGTLTVLTDS
jgi:hypothetical protein